jgi:hypothetical protein
MSKYKICKFVDGNGKEWYQVKKKVFWIFWQLLGEVKIFPSGRIVPRKIEKFAEVKKHIEEDKWFDRSQKIKKIECFDYVPEN